MSHVTTRSAALAPTGREIFVNTAGVSSGSYPATEAAIAAAAG